MPSYLELNAEIRQRDESGFFQLYKDKEAIVEFQKEVDEKMVKFNSPLERLQYLVVNRYYYKELFHQYTEEEVLQVLEFVNKRKHKWDSFMAISKFYQSYALRTYDKKSYLETYEEHVAIVALFLAKGNSFNAIRFAKEMIIQKYQPATPTFLNAGRERGGELVSCFLLNVDDTLNSITSNWDAASQLSKIGGGVALNVSNIRAKGETLDGVEGAARGIINPLKIWDNIFHYVDQKGQRKGAGAGYYNIFGADIISFLDSKKMNADEMERIHELSLGVIVPDKFIQLVADGVEDLYIFGPHSIYEEYGVRMQDVDWDTMYDELVENPNIFKKKCRLSPSELFTKIVATLIESGYPYVFFEGNANNPNAHPLHRLGKVYFSNLCTEIMQKSEITEILKYGKPKELNNDISCNLGSLNIVKIMEDLEAGIITFEEAVAVAMDMLTAVSDFSNIDQVPTVAKANDELHSVGLGYMNLHGWLAKNKVAYGSREALEFLDVFAMLVNYYSLLRSAQIAEERGETFKGYEESTYATGEYFDFYTENEFKPESEVVKEWFKNCEIPGVKEWSELKEYVAKVGVYHAYRQAIAPTQSIGYIQNSTQSIMPAVDQIEVRSYGDSKSYYPAPYLTQENMWYYPNVFNMDRRKLIDTVAVAQQHVDQGISLILYAKDTVSTEEIAADYFYAHAVGCKSVYYLRTQNTQNDELECLNCSV